MIFQKSSLYVIHRQKSSISCISFHAHLFSHIFYLMQFRHIIILKIHHVLPAKLFSQMKLNGKPWFFFLILENANHIITSTSQTNHRVKLVLYAINNIDRIRIWNCVLTMSFRLRRRFVKYFKGHYKFFYPYD